MRLLEFAPPECLLQPPSRQIPTDWLVQPLLLSGMGKEQGAADGPLLLPIGVAQRAPSGCIGTVQVRRTGKEQGPG
jgi:hypothetical protein